MFDEYLLLKASPASPIKFSNVNKDWILKVDTVKIGKHTLYDETKVIFDPT